MTRQREPRLLTVVILTVLGTAAVHAELDHEPGATILLAAFILIWRVLR